MRLVFVLSLALALSPGSALAQRGGSKVNVQALLKEGKRLYDAGKYREAAEALKQANEAQPHPRLVYNIAVALEYAGEPREAMSFYRQYVTSSSEDTDPTLLKNSNRAIDRLRVQLDREDQAQAVADADRKRLEAEAEAARQKADEEQAAARRAEEESERQRQAEMDRAVKSYRNQRIAAFATGGVAVVGVGVGVLFGLQARDQREQFDNAGTLADKQRLSDSTKSKALLADIGFGVGLAGAITAIILYPKEGPPAQGEVRVTLAPRGAGVGMEGRF
ncbi:tetratricopeptide repeat protein [Corallococcus caeni]|uniref:tetratricopeptide repeat protein n=1 Tax=Corallococcus caeni TaxID=3082388 RepID=UPI0030C6C84C